MGERPHPPRLVEPHVRHRRRLRTGRGAGAGVGRQRARLSPVAASIAAPIGRSTRQPRHRSPGAARPPPGRAVDGLVHRRRHPRQPALRPGHRSRGRGRGRPGGGRRADRRNGSSCWSSPNRPRWTSTAAGGIPRPIPTGPSPCSTCSTSGASSPIVRRPAATGEDELQGALEHAGRPGRGRSPGDRAGGGGPRGAPDGRGGRAEAAGRCGGHHGQRPPPVGGPPRGHDRGDQHRRGHPRRAPPGRSERRGQRPAGPGQRPERQAAGSLSRWSRPSSTGTPHQ